MGGNEERNSESEGWRYDGITEREREAVEGKEKRESRGWSRERLQSTSKAAVMKSRV